MSVLLWGFETCHNKIVFTWTLQGWLKSRVLSRWFKEEEPATADGGCWGCCWPLLIESEIDEDECMLPLPPQVATLLSKSSSIEGFCDWLAPCTEIRLSTFGAILKPEIIGAEISEDHSRTTQIGSKHTHFHYALVNVNREKTWKVCTSPLL